MIVHKTPTGGWYRIWNIGDEYAYHDTSCIVVDAGRVMSMWSHEWDQLLAKSAIDNTVVMLGDNKNKIKACIALANDGYDSVVMPDGYDIFLIKPFMQAMLREL